MGHVTWVTCSGLWCHVVSGVTWYCIAESTEFAYTDRPHLIEPCLQAV